VRSSRSGLFLGFCVFLLGLSLLAAGAWFSYYRPAVEYARADENETKTDPAPSILLATGAAVMCIGGYLLWRNRGN
jgi:hypothetical protein